MFKEKNGKILLNNKEKACLILICKRKRSDYLKANKYIYFEDDIDLIDEVKLIAKENIEADFIREYDLNISAEKIENIFSDLNVLKSTKNLSYREKLVLFSYYSECKKDGEIGKELHLIGDTVQKIRIRAVKKILKNYYEIIRGDDDVI